MKKIGKEPAGRSREEHETCFPPVGREEAKP